MASLAEVARDHAALRRRLGAAVGGEAGRLWGQVDRDRIGASWLRLVPRLLLVLIGAQQAAAGQADGYLDEVLDAQGIDPRSEGRVVVSALSGVASDGRDLADLLYQPAINTLVGIQRGATVDQALAGGRASLDMIVRTQVADAGRVADQVATAARPAVTGYVRMLVGASCSRCAILAGRHYRWNAGFQRHPRCFPAGVVVSGPEHLAASRRAYQGELVVIRTASGQELPATGNHPVLTSRGWLPANLIQEGDHVVRSTRSQGATALVVPHEDQMPARIEDLWRPDGVVPLLHMPTTAEDFHGDGGHGDVDVVLADRLLRDGPQAAVSQLADQKQLSRRVAQAALLAQRGAAEQGFHGLLSTAHGIVGGGGLTLALFGRHATGPHLSGGGHVADADAGEFEAAANHVPADAVAAAEAVLALASGIGRGEFGDRQDEFGARWDAPAGPLTVESRPAYARRGQELSLRLAGQVELDRVVELRRVEWSGHVYNLTSVEGWYSANGLIVSNCDCIHIPAREDSADDLRTDPKRYFGSLSAAEQDRLFTKAGAEAIRSGADIAKIVNSRRGMYEASGRLFTREAAGRRPRLMPEEILRQANGDRDEALRLLKLHRFLR